jgi:hypothetical protein
MYCNKCGRAVREGDIFCSHCGNKLPIETKIDVPEVQTTYEPITPPGADKEVYLQTGEPIKPGKFVPQFEERKSPKKESEFTWNTEDFKRTPKNSTDYEIDWQKLQIYEKHPDGTRTVVDEPGPSVTEEKIKEDVRKEAVAKDAAKIEKFYTFNQKLDEYQKLLDDEYNRVNKGRREAVSTAAAAKVGEIQKAMKEGTDIDWDAISSKIDVESREAVHKQEAPAPAPEPVPQPAPAPAEEKTPSEKDLEIQQKNFEGRFTGFFEAIQSGEPAVPSEGEEPVEEETGSIFDPVEHLKKAEEERASVEEAAAENSEIVDNDTLMKRFDTKELEKDVLEIEIEKERRRRAKAAEEPAEAEGGAPEEEHAADAEAPVESEAPAEVEEPAAEEPTENPFDVIFGNPDEENKNEAGGIEESDSDDKPGDSDESEDGESKGSFLKILIVIVAIFLGAELVLIGVQHLAPNSGLAKFINENLQGIVFDIGGSDAQPADTDDEAQPQEDEPVVAEGVPFTAKELAEHAKNFNDNIVEIKADKNLCYNPTETYKETRIAESQPLEYNIWYRDLADNMVYSDMAAADTLVKYNSMWIDYINSGDEEVFTVIAPDSKVYSNCKKATTKASEKIMKELTIGEVRKTEGGFLIWDREVITTTTKSGDVTTATYEMVYFLQDSAYELKVAECYTLKSN